MHRVCGTTKVGQCVPLHRVLQRQGFWERYYYNDDYHALLNTRLASVGNLEAYFLIGLRPIFMEACRSLTSLIEWLQHFAKAGHKLGMYVYALVLYRSNTDADNDDIARGLLRKLGGANKAGSAALPWKNQTCTWCHQDVY
jgi:hypothetical protein